MDSFRPGKCRGKGGTIQCRIKRRVRLDSGKKGFTLIELLIALVILAVGVLAIARMNIASIRGNFFSNHLTQATYVAQEQLEFLATLPYDSTALQPGNHDAGTRQLSASDIVFYRAYVVSVDGDLKTITFRVTWNEAGNRSIYFSTIRTR
jgi:prepilin-type N-terminal cleavage/methylation domain-containing protein